MYSTEYFETTAFEEIDALLDGDNHRGFEAQHIEGNDVEIVDEFTDLFHEGYDETGSYDDREGMYVEHEQESGYDQSSVAEGSTEDYDLFSIADRLNAESEGMDGEELEAYVVEAIPAALSTLVGALAPAVVNAVANQIPTLINRGRSSPRPARPQPVRPAPPRGSANTRQIAASLLQLIRNPQLHQMLQNIASGRSV